VVNEALVRAGIPRPEVEAMAAWDDCTEAAVDTFADQPEPARTVAEAAMATCVGEEGKYLIATHINDPSALREATMPDLLARVMAIRAARAKLPQEGPKTKPAIDYNRM
jgi:enamine deaminase RidA (YjgF/YER057c/UK114 family)